MWRRLARPGATRVGRGPGPRSGTCSCSTGSTLMGGSTGFRSGPAVVGPRRAAGRRDECAPHHPLVHETLPARRLRSRPARRRGTRAGRSRRGFGARAHRHRSPHGSAPAPGPERSGHRGAYAALVLCSRGFSLHAATRVAGPDRRRLERLYRYVAQPALAGGRLRLLASQQLCFALKTPWSDGTSHLLLSPGPQPPPHRVGQAGCRAGGGRRCEPSVLRPSAAVGDPAGGGVFLRHQRWSFCSAPLPGGKPPPY